MNILSRSYNKGFTLIQISILLTILAVAMVAVLPSYQVTNNQNQVSTKKMQTIMAALRAYQATYGTLPCPADPTIATGNSNYGKAAVNNGTTGNCVGGSPTTAAYALTTSTTDVAVGMVPVRTLGLPVDAALDGYGRDITYMVDTAATATPWTSTTLTGSIPIMENAVYVSGTTWAGSLTNSVFALISHGADGYGAWLPEQGTGGTGTAGRLNTGSSTEIEQADNAQVNETSSTVTNNSGAFKNYLFNNPITCENGNCSGANPPVNFDDIIVYKSNSTPSLNAMPISVAQNSIDVTMPALSGIAGTANYIVGENIPVQLNFKGTSVSISGGTPTLPLSFNGNSKTANYKNCATNYCTFNYPVQASDGVVAVGKIYVNNSQINLNSAKISVVGSNNSSPIFLTTPNIPINIATGPFSGISADISGNVIASDTKNKRLQIYSSGSWTTPQSTYTGTSFNYVSGAADDKIDSDRKYVVDTGTITSGAINANTGNIIKCNSASDCSTGTAVTTGATLSYPMGVAIDSSTGICWIADTGNNQIQKCSAGCTSCAAKGNVAGFTPTGMVAGVSNYIYVADTANNQIKKFDSTGALTNTYNAITANGISVSNPTGLAYDGTNIWVADSGNNRVLKCDTAFISCSYYGAFGSGTSPNFNNPTGITVGKTLGTIYIYVIDDNNERIVQLDSSGNFVAVLSHGYGSGTGYFGF